MSEIVRRVTRSDGRSRHQPTRAPVWRLSCVAVCVALIVAGCSSGSSDSADAPEGALPIPGSDRPTVGTAPTDPDIVGDTGLPEGVESRLEELPDFEELAKKYPDQIEVIRSSKLDTEAALEEVYDELEVVYQGEGADALHQFMLGTGLLQGIGVDTAYTDLALAYENGGWPEAEKFGTDRGLIEDGNLQILLELESEERTEVRKALEAKDVEIVAESGNVIEAAISVEELKSLGSGKKIFVFMAGIAQLPGVVKLKLPTETTTDQLFRQEGAVPGEGVSTTGANNWHAAGVTGEGIKVGIIDPDGFFGYDRLLGTDLPPRERVQVMPGQDTEALRRRSGPHGTGCAEIVTEMAPGVELFLARSTSIVSFSAAIDWMIESDVDVISYSAGRPAEPIDGTGPSGRDVMRAIDAGILWVNSSGNFGLSHLDMTFTDDDGNGFHEFPSGEEILPVTPLDESMLLSLVWDDPWVGAQRNYDLLFLAEGESGELETVASSRNIQAGGNADNPAEQIAIATPETPLFAAITSSGAPPGGRLNLLGHGMDFQYSIPEGSLTSPADLEAVLSVGATNWEDGTLEPYSSQGPTWDGRSKPNVVAPARVNSASYGGPFFGTSASAPHVAGAAALLFQHYPEATEAQIRAALSANATDIGPDGGDNQSGAGDLFLHEGPDTFTFDVDPAPFNESESPEVDVAGPTASLDSVSIERVPSDQGDVLRVVADVQINGLEGQQTQVASFFFFDTGRNIPLKDFNSRFASQVGTVAVGAKVTPDSDNYRVEGLELQIPLSELHLAAGERYELKVVTSISSELAWEDYLVISEWNQLVLET